MPRESSVFEYPNTDALAIASGTGMLVRNWRRLDASGISTPEWAEIDAAVAHLQVRVDLPSSRVKRAKHVMAEWRTGRYKTYALGAASAIGDLVRR